MISEVEFVPSAEKSDRARLKSAGPKPLSYAFDPLCKIKIAPHACTVRLTFVEECDGV
jgi:hypothetical protein